MADTISILNFDEIKALFKLDDADKNKVDMYILSAIDVASNILGHSIQLATVNMYAVCYGNNVKLPHKSATNIKVFLRHDSKIEDELAIDFYDVLSSFIWLKKHCKYSYVNCRYEVGWTKSNIPIAFKQSLIDLVSWFISRENSLGITSKKYDSGYSLEVERGIPLSIRQIIEGFK